jgi:hypothetical protein
VCRMWLWLSQTVEVLVEVGELAAKLRKEAVNSIILCVAIIALCTKLIATLHLTHSTLLYFSDMLAQDG